MELKNILIKKYINIHIIHINVKLMLILTLYYNYNIILYF